MKQHFFKALTNLERKRLFELIAMVVVALIIIGLSRLETRLFELSDHLSSNRDFFNSVIYFGMININVVLILILSFLFFRNVAKLVVERRQGVIGSKLKSKLVITLVFFALAPTTVMFYISSKYITTSFDTWFSSKVRDTMQKTREAGAQVYKQDQRRLESLARIALERIALELQPPYYPGKLPAINHEKLHSFENQYKLFAVKLYDQSGKLIWSSRPTSEQQQHLNESDNVFIVDAIQRFTDQPSLISKGTVDNVENIDVVKGAAPVIDPATKNLIGILITEEHFETQILKSINSIQAEFANLRPSAQLIRLSYLILLGVMVLIIIFTATWLGFYVARGITGPIQNLAEATKEVALGNYSITLNPKIDDETGQLVRAFNKMTKDLQGHKEKADQAAAVLRKTNEELAERRKYMEVILRNVTTGVISVDSEQKITSFNRAAEKLLNIQANKVMGKEVKLALGPKLWDEFWKPMIDSFTSHARYNGQIILNSRDQELILLAAATKIFDENNVDLGIVVVFDDATEKVKIQRVAAWREVARRIAHEIKNPLTPIKLSAQRLLRRYKDKFDDENQKIFDSCVETILMQVDSLRDLVNEFSKFSRLPSITPRLENINDVIHDVSNLFQMSYPHIQFVTKELQQDMPKVMLDKEQMNRVFVNIITNAISAIDESKDQGAIEFKTLLLEGAHAVRIEVSDNGSGIPEHIKDKVLEPYFSTKKDGTGLGLAIVNQIVNDHGGYLRILQRKPGGTTIVIELPLAMSVTTNIAAELHA